MCGDACVRSARIDHLDALLFFARDGKVSIPQRVMKREFFLFDAVRILFHAPHACRNRYIEHYGHIGPCGAYDKISGLFHKIKRDAAGISLIHESRVLKPVTDNTVVTRVLGDDHFV